MGIIISQSNVMSTFLAIFSMSWDPCQIFNFHTYSWNTVYINILKGPHATSFQLVLNHEEHLSPNSLTFLAYQWPYNPSQSESMRLFTQINSDHRIWSQFTYCTTHSLTMWERDRYPARSVVPLSLIIVARLWLLTSYHWLHILSHQSPSEN